MPHTAANWSQKEDHFTQMFYEQNIRQFWLPEEISLSGDILAWKNMKKEEQEVYKKVLAGLTLLDTEQGNVGMPTIMSKVEGHQRKAVLNFMGMMENAVHAKSYSNIFMTLTSTEEIKNLFSWVEANKYLQQKTRIIREIYRKLSISSYEIDLYYAMVASVFLESFLFYSGFYFPLLCYGQGRMMQSGEIINLIIRDEAIHGVYVGLLAQEIFKAQTSDIQTGLQNFVYNLLRSLYSVELEYTQDIYDSIGLSHDVKIFIRYNANKALQNLGFDPYFKEEFVNPVVMNGLNTKSKSHDFFSMKGNSYKMAIVEPLKDQDFFFGLGGE
jgi:ribonucleoside-diphosphate reductase beta chain